MSLGWRTGRHLALRQFLSARIPQVLRGGATFDRQERMQEGMQNNAVQGIPHKPLAMQ